LYAEKLYHKIVIRPGKSLIKEIYTGDQIRY